MGAPRIRTAVPKDAAAVLAHVRVVLDETTFLTKPAEELQLSADEEAEIIEELNEGGDLMLVAVDGPDVVAMLTARRPPGSRVRHGAEIGISVRKAYWGQRLGRRLLEGLVEWASAEGVDRLELRVRKDNTRAIALYEAMGFEVEGTMRDAFRIGARSYDELFMTRLA